MIKKELADYLFPLCHTAGDNRPYLFGAPFVDINPFVFVKICNEEISQDFCSNSSSNFTKKQWRYSQGIFVLLFSKSFFRFFAATS